MFALGALRMGANMSCTSVPAFAPTPAPVHEPSYEIGETFPVKQLENHWEIPSQRSITEPETKDPTPRWQIRRFLSITTTIDTNVPQDPLSTLLSCHDSQQDAELRAVLFQKDELDGLTLPQVMPGEAYCYTLARFAIANNRKSIRIIDSKSVLDKPLSDVSTIPRLAIFHEEGCRFYLEPNEMLDDYEDCECLFRSQARHWAATKDMVFHFGPSDYC